jgi:nitrate reductase gamma subunit
MGGLQLFFYLATFIFVVGTVYKAAKIARMPLHLRWDLYPIPHEPGKGDYGGSYYEEIDWWTKPMKVSIPGELKEMAKEIIYIQSMYHNNRPLWYFSFPFHFGLYLSVVFVLLIYVGALLNVIGIPVTSETSHWLGALAYNLPVPFGLVGAILGLAGGIGLFFMRLLKYDLRATSVWSDYFNLLLLMAVFATTLITWATVDPAFNQARAFIGSLMTVSPSPEIPALTALHLTLAGIFLLWLPLTHMTHFVGKYFTYHKVRWEDHPNIQGSDLEKSVIEALGYKITWSAPHIKSGGTWAEAATASDEKKEEKA